MKRIEISKSSLEQLYIIDGKTRKEVAKIYGCSVDTIKDRLLRFNLKKNIKSKNLLREIIDGYVKEGKTIKEMALSYRCSIFVMKRKLKEYGIRLQKKCDIDDKYFSKWSSNLSYLVGVIFTDGCVRDNRNELTLVSKDEELIIFFKNELKTNYKTILVKSKVNNNIYNFVYVYSKHIIKDLLKIGIVPRKSRILSLSKIPSEYMDIYFWDIMRGIVDGDGYIYQPKNRSIRFGICSGSRIFLEEILDNLVCKIKCPRYQIVKVKNKESYYLNINGEYAYLCLKKMYDNNKFSIKRKRCIALESMRAFENKKNCISCGSEMKFFNFARKYCDDCRGRY